MMFNQQDLPKLYHFVNDQSQEIKQEDKNARKTSPLSTSKLVSTNESKDEVKEVKIDEIDESKKSKSIEIKCEETGIVEMIVTKSKEETDSSKSERIVDHDDKSERSDLNNSKDSSSKDESNNSSTSSQLLEPSLIASSSKRPNSLNMSTLLDCINELKNNKSRVTKISLEKCFQRRNTSLPRNEISDFLNKLLNEEVLEKIKYRDYYGVRLKASYKNSKRSNDNDPFEDMDSNEESDKMSVNEKSSLNDKSSINDQDAMSNVDNLSECSSSVNALNDLNEELEDEDGSSYNTKKNSLKRCSPTIRYLLRTAPEDGVSPVEMLKALQAKRLLILYDLKKFIWLMKTYFVDKGICEQLTNGNYKLNNDEENSNASIIKLEKHETVTSRSEAKEDDEINLFADEKFSDNENFESNKSSSTQADLIKQTNKISNYLTVEKVNDAIDRLTKRNEYFDLMNILMTIDCDAELSEYELAAFITKCYNLGLIKKTQQSNAIMQSIKGRKMLEQFEIDDMECRKVISSLKVLMKNTILSPEQMLIGLKTKFKLLQRFNLVAFNHLIHDRLIKEGFLQELPENQFRIASEIVDEASNASNQSTPNPEIEYNDSEMELSNAGDKFSLKRKIKSKDDSTLRRPTSQRKKIKKSLGPDFLDPSGLRYENLRNLYEDKCEICFKNSDKSMIDCKRCKFKAHRQCLNNFDLAFRDNFKRFECEACRLKCKFCNRESTELINNLVTCKKCNFSYHANCLINRSERDKTTKNCSACEKIFIKSLMNKGDKLSKPIDKTDTDKQNILELDLNEASSNDINVQSNILEQVPTLVQLKEIEMAEEEILNLNKQTDQTSNQKSCTDKPDLISSSKVVNQSEVNSLNDESNDESNQSNVGTTSSPDSLHSNLENNSSRTDDETLIQKYRKLFQAYDVHQQIKITKEQLNTLKSLNSYSNGKNPADWTVDDVVNFISSIGFPDESLIFKAEEIDGKSLLLLRRNDVLTGLSMHLGPALKIYSHIYKLQASV